jgi:hypothetical protein
MERCFALLKDGSSDAGGVRDLLVSFDTTEDPFNPDGGLCGPSSLYQDLKKQICAAADVPADPKQDNTSAPCDALSTTIFFTAGPAKLGTVFDEGDGTRRCGTDWIDDCPK